jgi:hypothetical protein
MIEQGTDGLSRGDLTEGVIAGRSILDFVPLNKSALVCQPGLIPRLQSWIPASNPKFLQTPDWFNVGHGIQGGGGSLAQGVCGHPPRPCSLG